MPGQRRSLAELDPLYLLDIFNLDRRKQKMKIRGHLIACTLVAGLGGTTGLSETAVDEQQALATGSQAGYFIAKAITKKDSGVGQVGAQAGGAAIGGYAGQKLGEAAGQAVTRAATTRATTALGMRIGAAFGASLGPAGLLVGAIGGAV